MQVLCDTECVLLVAEWWWYSVKVERNSKQLALAGFLPKLHENNMQEIALA